MSFKPTCSRDSWVKRQALMNKVRAFFEGRGVLEVETPTLSNAGGTDPQLDYFEVEGRHFMMTSPEFHMKRLLSAGFGDIFQITKSFRKDEFGAHHNNEFSMVEWYRVGMPQEKLMDEVEALVSEIIGKPINARRTRWIDAFKNYAGVNPLTASGEEFAAACTAREIPLPADGTAMSREDWWDYLMVFAVEPALAKNGPEFILDYPQSQAALDMLGVRFSVQSLESDDRSNGAIPLMTLQHEPEGRYLVSERYGVLEKVERPWSDQTLLVARDADEPSEDRLPARDAGCEVFRYYWK